MPPRRERPALDVIRDLKSGTIAGKTLRAEQRRPCVEMLWIEDVPISEIATIVDKSEKTIHRDIEKIREWNAIRPTRDLEAKILGEYRTRVGTAMVRLGKLSRDPAASVTDRVHAINSSMAILDRFVERLQSIGFVGGDHERVDDLSALTELLRLAQVISTEMGDDCSLVTDLRALIARMHSSDTED